MFGHISKKRGAVFLLSLTIFLSSAILAEAALVNINTADSEELQTLEGIGPAYAQRIIDYRTTDGPFETIEEIKNVSGIGEVTFSKIKDSITVGSPSSGEDETPSTSTQTTGTENSNSTSNASSHYSASSLSNSKTETKIELSAGRNRLTTVGAPIEFKAETNLTNVKPGDFRWSFGDGTMDSGLVVTHTYFYPGEYAVVLNLNYGGDYALSRVTTKVVPANLSITYASPARVEIINNSRNEINLFGRAMNARGKTFIFPKDTIILANQKISFNGALTKLEPYSVTDVSLIVIGENSSDANVSEKIEEERLNQISSIQENLNELQTKLQFMEVPILSQEIAVLQATTAPTEGAIAEAEEAEEKEFLLVIEPEVQVAAVSEAATPEDSGLIRRWLALLKSFFLRSR